ncbi:type 2 lanthipeptide synthetase LanM family protein, partial [Kitasatospora sp. NPDC004240]
MRAGRPDGGDATAWGPAAPGAAGTLPTPQPPVPADRAASAAARAVPAAWWQPARLPGEAGPTAVPAWASFAEAALAAAPVRAGVPNRTHPGTSGFAPVVAPFTERAVERLLAALPARFAERPGRFDLPALRAGFATRLTERLTRTAARTLVLELNVARVRARLTGGTPQERFRDFVRRTASRDGLTALLHAYPVLARLLAQASLDAADAFAELLLRLAADRERLVATLLAGTDPGALVAVDTGAGDRHRRGRSVAVLHFATGTAVVHRPRPPAVHRHFNGLVRWFNALPGTPGLRTPRLLDRGGYGWLEHVEARPCRTAAEVERFYRRQGALLALLHVLDGTDAHYENLVACGEHPVLVDVETLFHPPVPAPADPAADDPAAAALRRSVQRVGLLPQLLLGDDGALDVSGLGGGHPGLCPVPGVDWDGAGTDTMRLVRRARPFEAAAHNRPRLAGAPVDPAAHTEALVAGFRAGYAALAAARGELAGPHGRLKAFTEAEVRVVPRATRVYATLLDESTHPDLLREASERDALLALLSTDQVADPGRPELAGAERAELWAGDIPLFTARPGRTGLWTSDGRRLPDDTGATGIARAEARLATLDGVDRRDQEWIVRASMAGTSTAPPHRCGRPAPENVWATAPEPEHLLATARSVGDRLVALAHPGPVRTNWLGLELLAERYWRVRAMGADLGGGYTGPALFLARLAELTGSERYADTARRALAPVPALLDSLAAHPGRAAAVGSGAFAGLGGIAYGLAEVAHALDDPLIAQCVEPAVRLTTAAAETETDTGVHGGTAGGLAALLAVHATTGLPAALHGAERCAERLAAAPLPAVTGFAHGSAGVGWALLRWEHRRTAGAGPADGRTADDRAGRTADGRTAGDRTAGDRVAVDRPADD